MAFYTSTINAISNFASRAYTGFASAVSSVAGFRQALDSRENTPRPAGASADYSNEQGEQRLSILEKARGIERDAPLGQAVLDRLVELIVGPGILPQAQTRSPRWNERAEGLLEEWSNESPEIRGMYDFYEFQRLVCRSYFRDGDVLAVKLNTGQLQLIEADRIHAPLGWEYREFHVGGIELDSNGKPKTYYVVPLQPNDHYIVRPYDYPDRVAVPAEHALFMARRTRSTQTRGISVFSGCLNWFTHMNRLVEATVINARMSACFGLLIESPFPFQNGPTTANISGTTSPRFDLEPGLVKTLMPGEKVSSFKPEQPTLNFSDFIRTVTRQIGLPAGLPLEILCLDFGEANYSVTRAAFMLASRTSKIAQSTFMSQMLKPIYNWKIDQFIAQGKLKDRKDKYKHTWLAPSHGWIDPTKEIDSTLAAINGGLTTRTKVLAELGMDFEDFVDQRTREEAMLEAAGLNFDPSAKTRDPDQNVEPSEDKPDDNKVEQHSPAPRSFGRRSPGLRGRHVRR